MTIFGHKMVILVQFTNTVIWTSFYQYDAGKQVTSSLHPGRQGRMGSGVNGRG